MREEKNESGQKEQAQIVTNKLGWAVNPGDYRYWDDNNGVFVANLPNEPQPEKSRLSTWFQCPTRTKIINWHERVRNRDLPRTNEAGERYYYSGFGEQSPNDLNSYEADAWLYAPVIDYLNYYNTVQYQYPFPLLWPEGGLGKTEFHHMGARLRYEWPKPTNLNTLKLQKIAFTRDSKTPNEVSIMCRYKSLNRANEPVYITLRTNLTGVKYMKLRFPNKAQQNILVGSSDDVDFQRTKTGQSSFMSNYIKTSQPRDARIYYHHYY